MNRKLIILVILSCIFLTIEITPIYGFFFVEDEQLDRITIKIKHHNPEDLTINVGYLRVDQNYTRGTIGSYTELKKVWNQNSSKETDYFVLTFDIEDLSFETIAPPKRFENVWFIEIEDHGIRHLKPIEQSYTQNMSEKEILETVNYLVGFNVTINSITYTSLEHPYFDDGSKVRAEIYGRVAETVINGIRSAEITGAVGIIGISHYANYEDKPAHAKDAWHFFDAITGLSYDGYIGDYELYYAIDRDYFPHYASHEKIYMSTVDSILDSVDASTDGDEVAIMYLESHGSPSGYSMMVYDTWWIFNWYTLGRLGGKIRGCTTEGTNVWAWLCWCRSDKCSELWTDSYYHNNRAVYWTYDHVTQATKRYYEIPEFVSVLESGYSDDVETIFPFVDSEYYYKYSLHMTQRDKKIPGYISLKS